MFRLRYTRPINEVHSQNEPNAGLVLTFNDLFEEFTFSRDHARFIVHFDQENEAGAFINALTLEEKISRWPVQIILTANLTGFKK